ncbi:alpha-tocopherol transfer protein-like [Folsomia candida]|uniref:Alpha-tocopherol transfer protein-like n=1 Tax=Folsomia candida TaxID=158441 RepID=A0A226EML2_FOLCA|nr:alpha-tocopherol transfer protein-like [Folsomia candida]XP_021949021.1 alpha-tocopherol transfer protein-like [Folsomia candida]OXA58530.1 Alpha-tocopherol transfer protein-like [Folsomia candida]
MNSLKEQSCLQLLRDLIQDDPDLCCSEEEEFLMRFLRAKDFKVDQAFQSLKNYVEMRKGFPTTFYPSAVKSTLESGMVNVLKHRDSDGRQIFYFRTYLWNTKFQNADDVFIACTLILEEMLNCVDTQKNGVTFIHDLKGLGFSHCMTLGLPELKRIFRIKGGFPARFKKAHAVNPSTPFFILNKLAYAFIPTKLHNRVTIYGKDMSALYESIPKECLPKSLGGLLHDDDAIDHELMNRLMSRDEYFKTTSALICNGSKRNKS